MIIFFMAQDLWDIVKKVSAASKESATIPA